VLETELTFHFTHILALLFLIFFFQSILSVADFTYLCEQENDLLFYLGTVSKKQAAFLKCFKSL